MGRIPSYPSIFALGHKAIAELLDDPVLIEEKIDGSQFSFGVYNVASALDEPNWELQCRSKGADIHVIAPDSMFKKAVETAKALWVTDSLRQGWTYRCEYLMKPKHNVLAYNRTPKSNLILLDVSPAPEEYLDYEAKEQEAERLSLEVVPKLFYGFLKDVEHLRHLLGRDSVLGGQKIEGVVIKNYTRFGKDKKCLMGKFVSEAFKEVHAAEWKQANPGQGDIVQVLISAYRTPARWAKAVQHLQERGELEVAPRDIGKLILEVPLDVEKECEDEIKAKLWSWAWPKIRRGLNAGLAEWYKERLLEQQFKKEGTVEEAVNEP